MMRIDRLRRPVRAQLLEPPHAPFVAGTARLDALAYPGLLLLPELVEAPVGEGLGGEFLRLGAFVGREVPGIRAQDAAVELDDARRHSIEESAVVRHDDQRGSPRREFLEPLDAGEIEVVGRLVEQQQVGLERERERERGALALAARETGGRPVGREPEAIEHRREPYVECMAGLGVRIGRCVAQRQARAQVGGGGKGRLLFDEGDRQPVAPLHFAFVEGLPPGEHCEQRGLAGAVAPDQADALSRADREVRVVQQGQQAEGEVGVEECNPGHARKITRAAHQVRPV
jgi:hypothetical protein